VVLLLGRDLVSWSLAMDERGGHKDLRGLGHRSIIPYVHGRTGVVLLKSALPKPAFLSALTEVASTRAFYSSRSGSLQ
jgi:hypothetical protein